MARDCGQATLAEASGEFGRLGDAEAWLSWRWKISEARMRWAGSEYYACITKPIFARPKIQSSKFVPPL